MRKLLFSAVFLLLPVLVLAQPYNIIKAKADIKTGVISGTVNGKPFSHGFRGDGHTFILYGDWFPFSLAGEGYKLELSLPSGFTAIAEADKAEKTKYGWKFTLDHPSDGMVMGFSDKWVLKTRTYKGKEIALYFSGDNVQAADDYFDRIEELMDMYTSMLGSYPYGRFAVADVPYPVGHALASLTFISDQIVRMPFLTGTSLGHELLHQWFGVSVEADSDRGNWSEGLTTYMADRLYEKQKGADIAYRKNSLENIMLSAGQKEKGAELSSFRYNKDNFSQAVGYSKGLMVFSMLEDMIGQASFNRALKNLCSDYRYKTASWADLEKEFEKTSGRDLSGFFKGWLHEPELADFDVKDIDVTAKDGGYVTSFKVENKFPALQFPLQIRIDTEGDSVTDNIYINGKESSFTVKSAGRPVGFSVDPQYRTARFLDMTEMRPVLYGLFSKYPKAVFVPHNLRDKYASVTGSLENAEVLDDTVNPYKYNDRILVFLDADNAAYQKYFGDKPQAVSVFNISAVNHPLRTDKMAYLITGSSADAVQSYFPRIRHYGKYTSVSASADGKLSLNDGGEVTGQTIPLKKDRQGVRVQQQLSIQDIVDENPYAKVIYVGETHDQYAHHINQLDVVKALVKEGKQVAIGLEMVQRPFQKYLDQYVAGTIDEKEMLRATEYYDRWRFDFRLYRPVFAYARDHRIPLIALNTPYELTEKVADKGIMALSDEDKKQIPEPFEYTGGEYRDRLYDVFMQHDQKANFENFYEAQLLWDETMAQSAYDYMKMNPERTMVIIAGNGHVRYKTSIPERLFRRNQQQYFTILQDEDDVKGIGDYVVYPDELKYEPSPKLGITIEDDKGIQVKDVTKDSPADKAGIRKNDVIISYNKTAVSRLSDLKLVLLYSDAGRDYPVTVLRDGKNIELKVRF